MGNSSGQGESKKATWDVRSMRVVREAQDIFWGAFSGSTMRLFFRVLAHSMCIFLAALAVFLLFGLDNMFEVCYGGLRKGYADVCRRISLDTLFLFMPSLCMFAIGSFISTKLCRDRVFQTSAFNTALLLFAAGIALSEWGITGSLRAGLLAGIFLSMYAGYRCSFFRDFRRNTNS